MPPDTAAAPPAPPLDETMLAMDVVDTLRHAETLVARELSAEDRAASLKARLREIYASQGIEVPDHILEQGVARIAESRFTYQPAPPGLQRSLATLWVTRARWGRVTAAVLGLLVLVAGGWWFGIERPAERARIAEQQELREGLPRALAAERERIGAATRNAAALERADRLLGEGQAAVRAGAAAEARLRLAEMQALRAQLAQDYTVRIVSRPGEQSGVWRVPAANPRARNYYLIVEAVDGRGRPVEVSITSEEDGRTARTAKWGLRVPEAEFERVRRDKAEDGVIDQPVIGRKPAGELAPQWTIPTTGGAILQW
ncbi:MAG: hypothetical protein K2X49_18140 [Acetobacteraceae bacterium]|nr:hypothetical protein [Acetobacteraceae bacterium]